jgi:hypothetical protein
VHPATVVEEREPIIDRRLRMGYDGRQTAIEASDACVADADCQCPVDSTFFTVTQLLSATCFRPSLHISFALLGLRRPPKPKTEDRRPRTLKQVTLGWHTAHSHTSIYPHTPSPALSLSRTSYCLRKLHLPYPVPLARPSSHLYRSEHNWEPP